MAGAEQESATAHILYRLQVVEQSIGDLKCDMYEGKGKNDPPVTTRLDRLETNMQEKQKQEDRTHTMMVSAFFLLLATFLTLIGNLIAKHL